ncbi:MAG: Uma2 family endonuclease [Pyrinomonadaceae bacterium]
MMSVNLEQIQHYFTLDEYFGLLENSDQRYEYRDGEIVCMSGGSEAHGLIGSNIQAELNLQLTRKKCRVFSSDQAIKAPPLDPFCFPDVSVTCAQREYTKVRGISVLLNPILLIEVASPEGDDYDYRDKRVAYLNIPSLCEYLIVDQEKPRMTHYVKADDDVWQHFKYTDMNTIAELKSIECRLSLSDIYRDVVFKE